MSQPYIKPWCNKHVIEKTIILSCECCEEDFDPEEDTGCIDTLLNTQCSQCIEKIRSEFE